MPMNLAEGTIKERGPEQCKGEGPWLNPLPRQNRKKAAVAAKDTVTNGARPTAWRHCSKARLERISSSSTAAGTARVTVVLVTEAPDYFGSHACKVLAQTAHMPVTCDSLMHGHRWAVRWGSLAQGDIIDRRGSTRSSSVTARKPSCTSPPIPVSPSRWKILASTAAATSWARCPCWRRCAPTGSGTASFRGPAPPTARPSGVLALEQPILDRMQLLLIDRAETQA
jgi:hypothetical protein